ncbi:MULTISPECIES: TetR/AcrR family transcriptional regulator [Ensifer]|uniref:TetR/AcrR family transcriptional regulator n=1 Tax=Ensifer TaxID=106591 RepID=UPI00072A47C3|nr:MULTISPECIES: TetR/AcrR family transcriptional regulator [Ensifer]KSV66713.1 TetR family transcriptional regulator [Sinorhizobium sp. GW3]OWZ95488.1 TetR family transcriptional regulator [Sinorhizobium sp. LM21]MBW0368655.1 TetR/AcrR family transcriptional regulator [Ensifer adhaerens]OKP70059.1 TetR family transcriptional regulator [Ensifer adhaerens]UCM23193.1 TetR/AcrR family transcriptional regulator [Ensifer adhaerens]
MVRTKKSPEVRSNELIDCAERLFFLHGYENTTVNDVIREANLSKGAFYHYFVSKEALLEAVATRLAERNLKELQPLFEDSSLDAVGRLNALFAGSRRLKLDMAPQLKNSFNALFKPENVALYHRIDEALMAVSLPLVAEMLRRGHADGTLDAPDPEASALMLLQLRLSVAKVMHKALQRQEAGDLDGAAAMLDGWMRTYGTAIERFLKLPDGTIEVTEPGFSRAFLEA